MMVSTVEVESSDTTSTPAARDLRSLLAWSEQTGRLDRLIESIEGVRHLVRSIAGEAAPPKPRGMAEGEHEWEIASEIGFRLSCATLCALELLSAITRVDDEERTMSRDQYRSILSEAGIIGQAERRESAERDGDTPLLVEIAQALTGSAGRR
ncbi:MAG: hypothetical protein ACF8PN_06745 [Phycisphaerales bacterium]